MSLTVQKRDASFSEFNLEKIKKAIYAAFINNRNYLKEDEYDKIDEIVDNISIEVEKKLVSLDTEYIHIEVIQDHVITEITNFGYTVISNLYEKYRQERAYARSSFVERVIKEIDGYIEKTSWNVKENSNMRYSLQGLNVSLFTDSSKEYWLNKVYDKRIANAHYDKDLHIHDLYLLAPYCVGWDLKDLLTVGFTGVPGKVTSKPAKHFNIALNHIFNFIYTLTGEAAGAEALSNFDTLLAPFVYYDRLSLEDVKRSMESFLFNMNVPTRVGFQCVSEDTEILTPNGWKKWNEVFVGNTIKTFNLKTHLIEDKIVNEMSISDYTGVMYNLLNDYTDQLISPRHRTVCYNNFTSQYELMTIEKVIKFYSTKRTIPIIPKINKKIFNSIEYELCEIEKIDILPNKDISQIQYSGKIWCPNTDNGTIIARRNGKIFITGNTPFSNITMDLVCPNHMKNEAVIIGGEYKSKTYGEFQEQMDMINIAFAEVMTKGDGNGQLFSFPIPTYCIDSEFDWDNPNYKSIWEMTAKYGIPYFANYINSDLSKEDSRSMCCRLKLNLTELHRRGGGLFGSNALTGSIGVVTINLPRIGHTAISKEDFFDKLNNVAEIAKDSLLTKVEFIEELTEKGLFPYTSFYLRSVKERTGKYWTNHFLTIGIIGAHEACLNFLGKGIDTEEGYEFSNEIMNFLNVKVIEFQKKYDKLFNLEATPSESTGYEFYRTDKAKYPDMNCFKLEHKLFYTNSTALPVNTKLDLFEALEHQNTLQTKYTGGTVYHIFIGEQISDPNTVKLLIKKILNNYSIPYVSISPSFSICRNHGYLIGEQPICPKCGLPTFIYSRVVGYLRPISDWNIGKQDEFKRRKLFDESIKKL